MSLSFCSLTRLSPQIHELNIQWNPSPNRSNFPLSLITNTSNTSSRLIARVLEQGLEVASPDTDVSLRNPVIDPKEEEEEVPGALNGLAGAELDTKTVNSSSRFKKKRDDEDGSDNRFKLRNGKEVFEEKTYLVGVERKGDKENLFGIEESLKELGQLADTAGLMVVGSTYQKLTSPNPRTYIGSGKVAEIKSAIHALGVETVIFDDELSAG
ncbi:hypothetical protein Pint_09022 [Pistacia integerrima]|uniref:Uncharacterized protein n=1 Tax=Pistacia integerrima TaxID=434235 RepID=A0ACC0XV67_9ROSI|nr:hypothetical protein Pint_09022 [Pistacia integerrima]